MAKYISNDNILTLISQSKNYLVDNYYKLLVDEEYGLDKRNHTLLINRLHLIRIVLKGLISELNLDADSDNTYDLYFTLAKLVDYEGSYALDNTLQVSDINSTFSNFEFVTLNSLNTILASYTLLDEFNLAITYLQNQINGLQLTTDFLKLTDTPNSYTGNANKILAVKSTENGLEFINLPEQGTPEVNVANVTVGGIEAGTSYTVGTIQDNKNVIKKILSKTYYPTFVNPSFSISNNSGGLRLIGDSTTVTHTITTNRGSILGKIVNGIWNSSAQQDFRLAVPTSWTFNGVSQGTSILNRTSLVTQGINTLTGFVSYPAGPQPLDSNNINYDSPYPAGNSNTMSSTFEGVYPIYATTSTLVTSTAQPLVSMITGNNIELNLVAELNGNKQFFELPIAWTENRPLQQILHFNTVSNQYDSTNKITSYSVDNNFRVINSNSIPYLIYINTSPDRGPLKIKLIF